MVTGTWHEPMGTADQETIIVRHQKKEAFRTCVSDGFAATLSSEDVPPRIGMSFIVEEVPYYSPAMRGSLELLAIGEMNEISLQFMRLGNEKIESATIEEVIMTLMRAQSTFELYANHDGSNFYRQSAKKQETFLRSLIESVQDVLPAPSALEALQIQDAITPEFYMKNPDGEGLVMFQEFKEGHPFVISGQVVGVNVHDLLVDGPGVYYASRDELDATQTGLCLMVKPSNINFPIDQYVEYDGSYLLLPLEKIQSLPLTLERTA